MFLYAVFLFFHGLFLVFNSWCINYNMFWCKSFWVHLWNSLDSWSWRSVSFPKLGKFSAIFIQVRFLPISLSLLWGTYTVMWMLVDWCSPISPTDHPHFFHFFLPLSYSDWVSSTASPVPWLILSSASSNLLLNLSSVFSSSIIVFCSILPKHLSQFSLCSYILLPCSVSI